MGRNQCDRADLPETGHSAQSAPATASFDDLRRRCLPEVLFVDSFLPEGVTICDVNVFAAMIEEAYHTPGRSAPPVAFGLLADARRWHSFTIAKL